MKKITKKTKKTIEPEILINTIDCDTVNDIYSNYIEAKANAGKTITKEDLDVVKNSVDRNEIFVFVNCACEVKTQKEPWYKRFWNWLRRKNK